VNNADSRIEQRLLDLNEENLGRAANGRRISRRRLFGSLASNTVVSAVGIGGLLELLASREALAVGMQITIDGVTREPNQAEETPHRHLFSVTFQVTSISPSAIMGNAVGRAGHVISTSSVPEDDHFHIIQMGGISLEQLILSGPEDNMSGGHMHVVSIE
jgi:hypothetical protein